MCYAGDSEWVCLGQRNQPPWIRFRLEPKEEEAAAIEPTQTAEPESPAETPPKREARSKRKRR